MDSAQKKIKRETNEWSILDFAFHSFSTSVGVVYRTFKFFSVHFLVNLFKHVYGNKRTTSTLLHFDDRTCSLCTHASKFMLVTTKGRRIQLVYSKNVKNKISAKLAMRSFSCVKESVNHLLPNHHLQITTVYIYIPLAASHNLNQIYCYSQL